MHRHELTAFLLHRAWSSATFSLFLNASADTTHRSNHNIFRSCQNLDIPCQVNGCNKSGIIVKLKSAAKITEEIKKGNQSMMQFQRKL